jgi:SAM-dependent methyltransferase
MTHINWEISPIVSMSQQARQYYWENIHHEDYENVWSISEDKKLLDKIIYGLKSLDKISRVLIIGCGSKVCLQNTLVQELEAIEEILCVDFPKVIKIASQKTNHSKVKYQSFDLTNLPWKNEWDVVININAILSENHTENSIILKNCYKSLKSGGFFLGFFPTIFCALDIAYLEYDSSRKKSIDCERSSFFEERQGIWQIFYTPLRLRKLLVENNFSIKVFEFFFFDSEYAKKHSNEYYNIQDPDLLIYEHYVLLEKANGIVDN